MKDLRRWGTGVIAVVLIASMSTSMAFSATARSGRLPDRQIDGTESPLVDAVGEPDPGGGGKPQEYIDPEIMTTNYWTLQVLLLKWLTGEISLQLHVRNTTNMRVR